jgi:hypothetical protein
MVNTNFSEQTLVIYASYCLLEIFIKESTFPTLILKLSLIKLLDKNSFAAIVYTILELFAVDFFIVTIGSFVSL